MYNVEEYNTKAGALQRVLATLLVISLIQQFFYIFNFAYGSADAFGWFFFVNFLFILLLIFGMHGARKPSSSLLLTYWVITVFLICLRIASIVLEILSVISIGVACSADDAQGREVCPSNYSAFVILVILAIVASVMFLALQIYSFMLARECYKILKTNNVEYVPAPEELPQTMPTQYIYSQPQYPTQSYPNGLPNGTAYYVYPPQGPVSYNPPSAPQPSYTIV